MRMKQYEYQQEPIEKKKLSLKKKSLKSFINENGFP